MTPKEFKKLKVGDKIKIKSIDELNKEFDYLEDCQYYDCVNAFTDNMKPYAGCIVTITSIYYKYVKIKEDNGDWAYSYDVIKEKCNVENNNKRLLYHYFSYLKEAGYNYLAINMCNGAVHAYIQKPHKSSIKTDIWLPDTSDTHFYTTGIDERELILKNKYLSSYVIYYIGDLIKEMEDK